jgi:ADP-ribose pyrophosphatase
MSAPNPFLYKGKRISLIQEEEKEIVTHPGSAVILPLIAPNKIIMIENRRIAVKETLLELPAGTIEDELPLSCAKRELQEETGFRAKSMKPMLEFYASPGYSSEKMYAFLAEDLHPAKPSLDPGEEITVVMKSFTEVIALIKEGKIQDAKTLVTLMHYILF